MIEKMLAVFVVVTLSAGPALACKCCEARDSFGSCWPIMPCHDPLCGSFAHSKVTTEKIEKLLRAEGINARIKSLQLESPETKPPSGDQK